MPAILAVVGSLLLGFEIWAARRNRKWLEMSPSRAKRVLSKTMLATGGLLVYVSLFGRYDIGTTVRVFGIPFLTSLWQFERGQWLDFTGPLTLPALLGNAVVAFVFPQLVMAVVRRMRS